MFAIATLIGPTNLILRVAMALATPTSPSATRCQTFAVAVKTKSRLSPLDLAPRRRRPHRR